MPALRNLKGRKFGRWLVMERSNFIGNHGQVLWTCICDCGTIRNVHSSSLVKKVSQSCGCLIVEQKTSHGLSKSPEYRIWSGIKSRCYNSKVEEYKYYGDRGIQVCERWLLSFENFYADMGPRPSKDHSIERRKVNGNYEPSNCYWATWSIQANNRRNNVLVEVQSETVTKAQAARKLGMSRQTFRMRSLRGNSIEEIAEKPLGDYRHREFAYNGEVGNISFWSKRSGISEDTLRYRLIVAKWPMEKALIKFKKKEE